MWLFRVGNWEGSRKKGHSLFMPTLRHRPASTPRWRRLAVASAVPPRVTAPSKCPFALAPEFSLPDPRPAALSPLGAALYSSETPSAPFNAAASLWLAAGVSGQNVPFRLVAGLRPLTHAEEFLNEDELFFGEIALKRAAFAARRTETLVAEERSLAAQVEVLEMFLDYLPQRYPSLYRVTGSGDGRTVSLSATGETLRLCDFVACPLELCARLVQEDLVLMRADDASPSHLHAPRDPPPYVLSAAAVVFSFADVGCRAGHPLPLIHAPVPGYEDQLSPLLNRTFAGLQVSKPLWRNNWALADTAALDMPSSGNEATRAALRRELPPQTRVLKAEFQTLRRLPTSNMILFTIRTYKQPMEELRAVPGAAAALAASLRGLSPQLRSYKGLVTEQAQEAMLTYLDEMAAGAH